MGDVLASAAVDVVKFVVRDSHLQMEGRGELDAAVEIVRKYRNHYMRTNCVATCKHAQTLFCALVSLQDASEQKTFPAVAVAIQMQKMQIGRELVKGALRVNGDLTAEIVSMDRLLVRNYIVSLCISVKAMLKTLKVGDALKRFMKALETNGGDVEAKLDAVINELEAWEAEDVPDDACKKDDTGPPAKKQRK